MGEHGQGNVVWFRPSFLEDPWAVLEGRPPQSILPPHLQHPHPHPHPHLTPVALDEEKGQEKEKDEGVVESDEMSEGEDEVEEALAIEPTVAVPLPSTVGGLVLPPPRYS